MTGIRHRLTQDLWGIASTAQLLWTQTWVNIKSPIYTRLSTNYRGPFVTILDAITLHQTSTQTPSPTAKTLLCTAHGLFVTIMVSILDVRQLMYIAPSPWSNSSIAHSLLNGNNEYLISCVHLCTSANGIHSPNVPNPLQVMSGMGNLWSRNIDR